MNDLANSYDILPQQTRLKPRVALFVDGDNMSPAFAGRLVMRSVRHGELIIKRVFGNIGNLPGWDEAAGFRTIHAGSGKNAADVLLCVEAMAIMLRKQADVLVIASSDRDFSHLAQFLVEEGTKVIGIGEAKTPEKFRKSCSVFDEIAVAPSPEKPAQAKTTEPTSHPTKYISEKVEDFIRTFGATEGCLISDINPHMHKVHGIKISEEPEKTWRKFLELRDDRFLCEPAGQQARVRLKKQSTSPSAPP